MISLSVWLSILPQIPIIEGDLMLAALCGGAIQGLGIGLAFSGRGTTGGVTWLPLCFRKISVVFRLSDHAGDRLDHRFFGALVFGFSMVLYAVCSHFYHLKSQ